eukprot:gnl/TRDRNA2_/TRDRNA2_132519_c0_seq1.p1 gnl/TRDRNA2_/TRDRNA2_132519_c0~~gnl/TRDRNA2_/TRDRNA2_132519_c0_seq1.p1  ORF type:complete len:1424 (-),score=306.60 gnl/TRDRNA2_/TRDRNA2_132519_c0_seq1:173-3874(-)
MGYHGNLKRLWAELDASGDGFVSLSEIDQEVGRYVGTFKLELIKKYGDMLTAWRKGLDKNGNGRIEEPEVREALEDLGLKLDSHKLYKFLRCTPGGLGLCLKDFDPEAWKRWVIGDLEGIAGGSDSEFIADNVPDLLQSSQGLQDMMDRSKDGGRAAAWRAELRRRDREEAKAERENIGKFTVGLSTAEGFKRAMRKRCGSLLGAWRYHLDLDGNGKLSPGEFGQALHRLGITANIKQLWSELDVSKSGYICFEDFDPEAHAMLSEFKTKITQEYGNMLLGWMKAIDHGGTGCVDEAQFLKCCEKIGYTGNAKKLFRLMKPEVGRHFITLLDIDVSAHNALVRGDFRMITEEGVGTVQKRPLEMTFDERNQAGFFFQIRKAWDASEREEFAKACRTARMPEKMQTLEEFDRLCIRKYGTLMNAWRQCLDADGNGKLTFNELCNGARYLGYGGDLQKLWRSLDTDNSGSITIREIDAKADDLVKCFMLLIKERFGDIDAMWKVGFGKDPHDSIDEGTLTKACEELGYPYDAKKLFRTLQPMPGRQLITIWDIDPECARRKARGDGGTVDAPAMTPSQKAAARAKKIAAANTTAEGPALTLDDHIALSILDRVKKARGRIGQVQASLFWRNGEEKTNLDLKVYHPSETEPLSTSHKKCSLRSNKGVFDVDRRGKELGPALKSCMWPEEEERDEDGYVERNPPPPEGAYSVVVTNLQGPKVAFQVAVRVAGVMRLFKGLAAPIRDGGEPITIVNFTLPWPGQFDYEIEAQSGASALEVGGSLDSMPSVMASPSLMRSGTVGSTIMCHSHLPSWGRDRGWAGLGAPPGNSTAQGIRDALTKKYGSTVAAWRLSLDPKMKGGASFKQFCSTLQEAAFHGNLKALWEELTEQKPANAKFVALKDVDPEASMALDAFRNALLASHPSIMDAWWLLMDVDGTGLIRHEELIDIIKRLGGCGIRVSSKRFVSYFAVRSGQRSLSPEDLEPLLIGVPAKDRSEVWDQKGKAEKAPPHYIKVPGRSGAEVKGIPGEEEHLPTQRAHVETILAEHHGQQKVMITLEAFKKMLVVKYGSLFSAWRHGLDVDHNGVVTQADFAAACRRFGITQTCKLWKELDTNGNGQISVDEMDPELGEYFEEFEKKLIKKYKTTKEGWRKGIDPGNTKWIDLPKWCKQLEALGYSRDPEKLYKMLRPEPFRSFLTYEDIWLNLNPNEKGKDEIALTLAQTMESAEEKATKKASSR